MNRGAKDYGAVAAGVVQDLLDAGLFSVESLVSHLSETARPRVSVSPSAVYKWLDPHSDRHLPAEVLLHLARHVGPARLFRPLAAHINLSVVEMHRPARLPSLLELLISLAENSGQLSGALRPLATGGDLCDLQIDAASAAVEKLQLILDQLRWRLEELRAGESAAAPLREVGS